MVVPNLNVQRLWFRKCRDYRLEGSEIKRNYGFEWLETMTLRGWRFMSWSVRVRVQIGPNYS